nr:MAG TPA: hypothetical protein [Caudoviricetes sp.]
MYVLGYIYLILSEDSNLSLLNIGLTTLPSLPNTPAYLSILCPNS